MKISNLLRVWLLLCTAPLTAQIIFTESLAPVIDTNRTWQGSIAPELNFKTEKQNFFQVKNNANINVLLQKKKAITLINQLEITSVGNTINVSNGFFHLEYRYLVKPRWEVYPFAEAVWVPSRGLQLRIATGLQARYRLIQSEHFILTSGFGTFFEYEHWNTDGVPDEIAYPYDTKHQRTIKARLALGLKIPLTEKWNFTTSGYIHSRWDSNIANPRFAYNIELKHHFTEHFGIWISYQAIQHTLPVFPIKKLYVVFTGGVFISW